MALSFDDEVLRRQRIVDSVVGTHAMEGIEPDPETLALYRRYIAGELSHERLDLAMEAHANSLVERYRSLLSVA